MIFFLLVIWTLFICSHIEGQSVHTWQTTYSNQNAACQLSKVFETDFEFVDSHFANISSFEVSGEKPFTFGLQLGTNATFNMLFALTCVRQDNQTSQSPKVTFLVGADSPAHPVVDVNPYYGATGKYVVTSIGENFYFYFPF